MITVKLMGGMGNQMFQYAFAKSNALYANTSFYLDESFLIRRDFGDKFVYRNLDLDLFNTELNIINKKQWSFLTTKEKDFSYDSNLVTSVRNKLKKGKKIYASGYWQSPKYFADFEQEIREDFTFKDRIEKTSNLDILAMLQAITNSNSVVLNVRRTDFLTDPMLQVQSEKYLNDAVGYINERVSDAHYFVFSDDIEWCQNNIKLPKMTIVDHRYKGERFSYYLQLMIACKHFIIPNSSFAWWAAFLNQNTNKIVVAPQKWFGDVQANNQTTDLIPESWSRL